MYEIDAENYFQENSSSLNIKSNEKNESFMTTLLHIVSFNYFVKSNKYVAVAVVVFVFVFVFVLFCFVLLMCIILLGSTVSPPVTTRPPIVTPARKKNVLI